MTIGKLAQAADVNVETVRYYQRIGLLSEPEKPRQGFRRYGEEDLEQLLFIRRAKELGFSLDRIEGLLELRDGPQACAEACAAARRTLLEIRSRIAELERLEVSLSTLLNESSNSDGCQVLQALTPP